MMSQKTKANLFWMAVIILAPIWIPILVIYIGCHSKEQRAAWDREANAL